MMYVCVTMRVIEDVVNSSQDFINVTLQSKLQVDVIAKRYHPNLCFSRTKILIIRGIFHVSAVIAR